MGLYLKTWTLLYLWQNSRHFERWYISNDRYGSGSFETDKIPRSDYGYNYLKGRIEFNFRIMYEAFLSDCFVRSNNLNWDSVVYKYLR